VAADEAIRPRPGWRWVTAGEERSKPAARLPRPFGYLLRLLVGRGVDTIDVTHCTGPANFEATKAEDARNIEH
jgi:hypothetical protein